MKVRTSENFSVSGHANSTPLKFPSPIFPRRKSGSLDDILLCFPHFSLLLSLSPPVSPPGSSLIFVNIFFHPRHFAVTFSPAFFLPSFLSLSLFFSHFSYYLSLSLTSRTETFPQTLLQHHSHLVYPPVSIRIAVACYIMAYQLFCQFPVRAPDEWDFFLCFF